MSRDLLDKFTRHRFNFHKSAPLLTNQLGRTTIPKQVESTDDKPVIKKNLGYSYR